MTVLRFALLGLCVFLLGCGSHDGRTPQGDTQVTAPDDAAGDIVHDHVDPPHPPDAPEAAVGAETGQVVDELPTQSASAATNDSANRSEAGQDVDDSDDPDGPNGPATTTDSNSPANATRRPLSERLSELTIPPAWIADVQTSYDTSHEWKDARLEIRRLLGIGTKETHREALKLTWLYYQADNMNDGHEYPMYTFLGGEPLWSIVAHREYLAKPHENTPIHAYITLASLYAQVGEFEQAEATLQEAMSRLPEPPWKIMRQADLLLEQGNLYAAWGKTDVAKEKYAAAVATYPLAKPPYGGNLLTRRAADAQARLDRLTLRALDSATLRDGVYQDKALGYVEDIHVTMTVHGGRIADIQLKHKEKIDQNACVLVPQWITQQQSLDVDAISGATVTRDAIINGTYRCLRKAGLK